MKILRLCTLLLTLAWVTGHGQYRSGTCHHLTGDDFLVNDDSTGGNANQHSSEVTVDNSGNITVAWIDFRRLEPDLYLQYYESTGRPIGRNMRVNIDGGVSDRYGISIAVNDAGSGAVVWCAEGNVLLQRFAPGGTLVGPNVRVNDEQNTVHDWVCLVAATNAKGEIAVVWTGSRSSSKVAFLQRYDSLGVHLGGNVVVNDDSAYWSNQLYTSASVALNDSGNVAVVWEESRNDTSRTYIQRFDGSGSRIGNPIMVTDQASWRIQIALSYAGSIAVVWNGLPYHSVRDLSVWCQRYTPGGARLGDKVLLEGASAARLIRWDETENAVILSTDDHYDVNLVTVQCYDSIAAPVTGKVKLRERSSYNPPVALNKNGCCVTTWAEDCNHKDNYQIFDIYLQRFDRTGVPTSSKVLVNDDGVGTANQYNPNTALNDRGAGAIVWEDYRSAFSAASSDNSLRSDIYLQLYGPSGVPRGANILVSDSSGSREGHSPSVAMNALDNTAVVWTVPTGCSTAFGEGQVYLRRFGPDGVPLGMTTLVADSTGGGPAPSVALSDSGQVVTTWTMPCGSVYLQRFNSRGEQAGGRILVNDTLKEQGGQSYVAMNASSAIAVMWMCVTDGGWTGAVTRIYLQQFHGNGERAGTTHVLDEYDGTSEGLSIDMNDSGYVAATWIYRGSDDTLFIQYFNPQGTPLGSKSVVGVVSPRPELPRVIPAISIDDSGNAVVLWTTMSFGRANPDIMCQRLLPFGVKLGEPFCVPMSEGPYDFQRNVGVSLNARKILCTWEDNRRLKGRDIYGKFSTFVWDPLVSVAQQQVARPGQFVLEQNYPNPFNPTTVVSYQLPVASNVKLGVYDILGSEVKTLVDERKEAGTHTVTFDGIGLSSGVYICRMIAGTYCQSRKMLLAK